eukprot:TRINITY_DN3223_c0_g1_i1.p1 TRINITY_DN3223_c0_g1~~TRINITY_DN3223_c0_g1_i1.p1  ORF type:complete len:346 (+),score=93.72 TRINITY_DN3223_c0_g1_i1:99-1040(+)
MPQYGFSSTAEEVSEGIDATGKTAIVTGASSGIGVETTRVLALRGAHVIMAVRNVAKGEAVAADIRKSVPNAKIEVEEMDLSNFDSVRNFAARILARKTPINLLINNAGIMPVELKLVEGYESHLTTCHLGHFLLTTLLLPAILSGAPARIVNVSSAFHIAADVDLDDVNFEKTPYDRFIAYGRAKSANIHFTKELNRRYSSQGVESFCLHPGGIKTPLQDNISKQEMIDKKWINEDGTSNVVWKTTEQGTATTVLAALHADLNGKGGSYLVDCNIETRPANTMTFEGLAEHANNQDKAEKLWIFSEKAVEKK